MQDINERFTKMVGKRLNFKGKVDEIKQVPKNYHNNENNVWRVSFTNVVENDTNIFFRDHVHVIVPAKIYKKFFKDCNALDTSFQFQGEVYSYFHKMKTHQYRDKKVCYRELGIGLRDIKGIKKVQK